MMHSAIETQTAQPSDISGILTFLESVLSLESGFVFNRTAQRKGLEMLVKSTRYHLILAREHGSMVGLALAQKLPSLPTTDLVVRIEEILIRRIPGFEAVDHRLLAGLRSWATEVGANRLILPIFSNRSTSFGFFKSMNWCALAGAEPGN